MIHFVIPVIPPSSNNAYFNLPSGGRTLTKVGKKFKDETKTLLTQKYMKELKGFVVNEPYLMLIRVTFKKRDFYNMTFAEKKGAESRYKRMDVLNRAKLLEDVIKDVTGVDDSHTMTLILDKRSSQNDVEQTDVFIWNTQREESPFDEPLARH